MKTIRLENIRRSFQVGDETVHALQDVTLDIDHGEYISIMGPSGSGKSTLLNILGLLDRPNAGVYQLEGEDTTGLSDRQQAEVRRHKIGFVFQFFHLIPRLSAAENVELPLVLAGVDAARRKARVAEALGRLGLADRAKHRPDQLSGGQRQRVAIARATIMKPAIVLADEPTGNLDAANSEVVERLLVEMVRRHGTTLIVVTHDNRLSRIGDRSLRLTASGLVEE